MKRTFKFLVAVAAVAFAASCGNNNPIDQGPAVATVLEVAPAELSFAAEGAQPATVEVTSDGSWVVVNSNDWLSVDPKSGDGNGTLTVTVADNKSGSEVLAPRSAEFSIVATDKLSKTVKVAQEGDSERLVEAVPYHIDFTEGQGTWTIVDVEMSEALTYVWSQTSNYGMKASAFVNSTNQPSVSLLCSPIFDLTAQSVAILSFTHARKYGNLDQLSVVAKKTTDADWTTLEVANWPDGGSWDFIDSGEIDLSAFCGSKIQIAFRYTSSDSAAATWEIKTFDLTNDASPKLGVSAEEIEVEATETSASFNVTGNVNWTAVASEGASVEPAQGKGGATLTVSFPVNTNTESGAEYTVTVSTTEEAEVKSYEVVIKQAAFVNNYKTYTTLAEIQEAVYGGETQFYMDIDWIDVTMVSNVNVFAEDRTAGILFYKTGLESSLQAGMRIKGKILATASVYNNLPEITAVYVEEGATSTDWNSSWPCTSLTIEQLVADYNKYINRKVKIDGVFVNDGWSSSDRNGVIAQGENTINVYVQGNQEVVETGCEGNIVCWPTYYKETKQVGFWPNPDAAKTFFTVTKEPSHPENVDLSVSEWRLESEIEGAFTEFKFTTATDLLYGEGDAEDGFWEDEAYPGTYTYDGSELAIVIDLDGDVIELTATIDGNSMTFTSGAYEGLVFTKYEGETVSIANTPETAYTATEAIALIDAGKDLDTPVYVKGVVKSIVTTPENVVKYGNVDLWITDEAGAEFEFYRMKDIDNAAFTELTIGVGDKLVAYGTLAKYNTTYELKNDYLISREAASVENIELDGTYWSNGQTGEDLMALDFANGKVTPTLYGSPYGAMDYTVEGNTVVFGGYYMGTVTDDTMVVTYMGSVLATLTKGEKPAELKTYTTFAAAQAAILAGETTFILDLAEFAEFTFKNADNKSLYAQDATGGMLFYNTGAESWAYGGLRFKGGALKCTAEMFRGNPQIKAVESWAAITKDYNAKYPCHTITLSELLSNFERYINCKVKITGVSVTDGWGGSDRNGEIAVGADKIAVYQKVKDNEQGAQTGCEGDIVAWPTVNNSDKQLAFWAHPEYPAKTFFTVTKEAPTGETEYKNCGEINAAILAGETDLKINLEGPAEITLMGADNKTIFIQDATGGVQIYSADLYTALKGAGASAGYAVKGSFTATGTMYSGLPEITAAVVTAENLTGTWSFPCKNLTIAEILADTEKYYNCKVKIADVEVKDGWSSSDKNGKIAQNGNEIAVYVKNTAITTAIPTGAKGALVGYVGVNNGTKQVTFWEEGKFVATSMPSVITAASSISLAVGETQNLSASVNSGATLSYSSDADGVATVSAEGVVTAVAAGEANITISAPATGIYTEASVTCKVTVTASSQHLDSFDLVWQLKADHMDEYKDLFGGTDGVVSSAEGFGELADGSRMRVPSTSGEGGNIYYYQVDKTGTTPTSGNPKRVVGGTGDPYITGGWPGDYWLIEGNNGSEYPAGTQFNINFLTRVSGTGHKYMLAEYWDGEAWQPAFEVKEETETGTNAKYNFVQGSSNKEVNVTWTLEKATKDIKFRLTIAANWQQNGKGALANPNGGTCRISERCELKVVTE